MKKLNFIKMALVCATFLFFVSAVNAESGKKKLRKPNGVPNVTKLNINNISTYFRSNGDSDLDNNGNSGFEFPKGSGKTAVFESGFLWGANVNGEEIRVGGSAYSSGLQPGKIISPGVAEDPNLDKNRIYRVRPDYRTASLENEARNEGVSEDEVFTQYETDWFEWPAEDGAPFNDLDSNGVYDPNIDIPGFPGASQTIWFVANDLNADNTTDLYGSNPMGIEMQATIWAYSQAGALGNMLFRKYTIINKSTDTFEDMYVTMWSDPDVGDASDDFAGSDTLLSLGYAYNASPTDATYGDTPPPAMGFDFFQGPVVDSPGDTAIVNGEYLLDKKNLPMTSFYYFARGDLSITDPTTQSYEGTLQFYNFMQGKIGKTGEFFQTPADLGAEPTTFTLSGDPVAGTGWLDGQLISAGDRRIGLASGPFTMEPGDAQEVVVAQIAAIGGDRIGSVDLLKNYDIVAQDAYDNFFQIPTGADAPIVSVTELDQKIILSWDSQAVKSTENYTERGYEFQGYNVYQLPAQSSSKEESRLIATYDIIDDVKTIYGFEFDPRTGADETTPVQFGTDSGIKRSLEIEQDILSGGIDLNNGSRYYYAVTSYSFNPDPLAVPNVLENPLSAVVAVPHSMNPGERLTAERGEQIEVEHTGTADAEVVVEVVDPTKLTGHQYEVFFNTQHYYLDADGVWKTTNFPDSIGKVLDVSPSTLTGIAVYSKSPGTVDLNLLFNLVSPTDAWVDGIELTLPAEVGINSAADVQAGGGDVVPIVEGNKVIYGLVNMDTTGNGVFHGDEVLNLNLSNVTLPLSIDYVIHDDGFGSGGNPINAQGTLVINEIGNDFATLKYWNVRDLTSGEVVVEMQTFLNGADVFTGVGPGGSGGLLGAIVGTGANPIFDGLQVSVQGSYEAPITQNAVIINGFSISGGGASQFKGEGFTVTDYTWFSEPTGWSVNGSIDNGRGTTDVNELQKDYELRFTGELEEVVVDDVLVSKVKEGTGSVATLYGARQYDIADHPLNPNPGSNDPFLINIPFEVWNVDDNQQVNLLVYHREGTPSDSLFKVWNSDARMYMEILNTPYSPTLIDPDGPEADNLTWNVVFYESDWEQGDVVELQYANPLQSQMDVFTFTAPDPVTYNQELAESDVDKINVFPNPYYGVNPEEINKYQRFVTFSHLPEAATIRIFNLGGLQVRRIDKDDASQFARWDLANDAGLPVASGMYIAYIDMLELGTKILKLAVIQEQQILDRF